MAQPAPPTVATDPARPLAGAQVVAGVVAAGRTALGLPADVRTPWSSTALAAALRKARRYHEPLRAAAVVDWVVPAVEE